MSKARNISDVLVSPDFTGTVTADGLVVDAAADSDNTLTITSAATANNTTLKLGTDGNNAVISGSGGSTGGLKFKVYGTERMAISQSGKVGIGTGSPTSKIHATTATAGYTAKLINTNGASDANGLLIQAGTAASEYALNVANTAGNTTFMVVKGNGNVGIGNSSPQGRLHLNDSGTAVPTSGYGTGLMVSRTDGLMGTMFGFLNSPQSGYLQSANFTNSGTLPFLINPRGGNVGIGTSSPDDVLTIDVNEGSNNVRAIHLVGGPDVTNNYISIGRTHTTSNDHIDSEIRFGAETGGNGTSFIALATGNNNSIERMRVDNSGSVLIGRSSAAWNNTQGLALNQGNSGENYAINNGVVFYINRGNTEGKTIRFYKTSGTEVGNISTFGASTAYNTSSDYRLKTDVQPITAAADRVKLLKPCNFEWIADGSRADGFLAHELAEVVPIAVTGAKDAMEDEEYEVSPATGDIYTAAIEEVATESQVMEAVEAGSYVNLAGETIVETEERGVTTDLVETVVQRQDIDGISTEVEVEVTTKVPTMETVITTEAVDEIIHSADVEHPETLEDGQAWRETTAQVMATRSVPDMQGIDQSKLAPLLVATLQEALAEIETLKTRLTALEE